MTFYRTLLVSLLALPLGPANAADPFVEWLREGNASAPQAMRTLSPSCSVTKCSSSREYQDGFSFDVCVYGGTSGGVAAAVQAARMGKRVVLVEPGRHLGGMTSGGLSAVDIGDPRSVGGIVREYFTRLVARYGKELNWGEAFKNHGKGGPATGGAYSIEPHVAEQVFDDMAAEAGVTVLREARLKSVKLVDCDRRAVIAKEIENYHRGLLHFLATDRRVPRKVREDARRFALPKDEFADNENRPYEMYVRHQMPSL